MRAVVQRVRRAEVTVDSEIVGAIGPGLCVLLGVTHGDTEASARKMADKLSKLRIFADADDKMNLSLQDVEGEMLVVSQFTLYGDAAKGNRPSFVAAASPEVAEPLIGQTIDQLRSLGLRVETGRFRADMDVELVNWGPVTIVLEV